MDSWGWPMTIEAINNLAVQILEKKGDFAPLGVNWYRKFLARHPNLKTIRSRVLDQARKDASDEQIISRWFDLVTAVRTQYGILDNDSYNMDEKGCMKGVGDNTKVIVRRSEIEAFCPQPGNREWVSIIECINAINFVLPPFITFEGQRLQSSWSRALIDERKVIRVSPNGWTDREIALEWLKHFDSYTKPRKQGEYRLLILDGHSSHTSLKFISYCEE